ncbi:aminodeoxychorismate synthase component I [Actinophytocola oryzae]|uniref:aminodeoxychorismate synthase n=1 Tax=Actinophytocola oryzae TaxID=502181 RepID=A0A4R7V908_9PSEU|nr:aminodeoxychorismate synthase component I [Actinophytocola oryzae]TDV45403.1 para-aminobenzoate synthetase [Actinophytocola oryzae]
MGTLIIDNYDSFTYNLCHLVGAVTGVAPTVVRNDEPVDLDAYTHVILSPGPGRPERRGDFGVCADVIRTATIPLLGVCLGHQGICHVHGGTIGPAPHVRHGQTSPILHDGSGLFAGLPSPFDAVRYHSLVATTLPDTLEPIATSDDGVLMGVRHRHRPQWGVQFHPESIRTRHGHRLLANFLRQPRTRPVVEVRSPRRARTIEHRRVTTGASAETVFDALFAHSDYSFWLDSADEGGAGGRFSFLGDASGPHARVATADVTTGTVTVRSADRDETVHSGFLDWLAADLAEHRVTPPDLPFEFALGWVGYLGYELKAECGSPNTHRSEHPDAAMIFADRAIVFDHLERQVHLLALSDDGWFDEVEATLPACPDNSPDLRVPDLGPLRPRHGRDAYLDLVAACQREIVAGETYEVCLTNQLTAHGKLDPWPAYRRLRRVNPEPFGALLRFGELSVLSASPERFLRVTADGVAESKPIKGTRPRGATPARDAALRHELATSAKDRAENLMIVDLVRNDLGSVAALDGVTVADLFDVETHPTVHQLVSTVRARLRPDRTAVDVVRAAFPGGSMTGAPKLRTMAIIDRLEGGSRGVYAGALGYFSLSGAADLSIVIRTLVAWADRVSYGVGGAIIALSTPDEEMAETVVKAAPLLRLTGQELAP